MEIRFHEDLYDGFAIDEAVKVYSPYATFSLSREPGGFIVAAEGHEGGADPAVVLCELANYALGKTIEKSRAPASPSPADVASPADPPAPKDPA